MKLVLWNLSETSQFQVTCVLVTVLVMFLTPKGKDVLVTARIVVFLYLDACVISSYIFGICESRESQCSLL